MFNLQNLRQRVGIISLLLVLLVPSHSRDIAKADLHYFPDSKYKKLKQWSQKIPANLIPKPITINIYLLSPKQFEEKAKAVGYKDEEIPVVIGFTEIATDCIYIKDVGSDRDKKYCILHEYGHVIWYHILNPGMKEDYNKLWQVETMMDVHPTGYGETDVIEGWAEAFMLWCARDKNQNSMEKKFLDSLLPRIEIVVPEGINE